MSQLNMFMINRLTILRSVQYLKEAFQEQEKKNCLLFLNSWKCPMPEVLITQLLQYLTGIHLIDFHRRLL